LLKPKFLLLNPLFFRGFFNVSKKKMRQKTSFFYTQ